MASINSACGRGQSRRCAPMPRRGKVSDAVISRAALDIFSGRKAREKAMSVSQSPPRTELVDRAAQLVPLLKDKAVWMDENRRMHDEVIAALTDAGLLRMRVPVRYGGYESDMTTVADVLAELGRGDGAVSWTASVWAISTWMTGMFPDEVQDEVFSTPDVRISG